MPELPSGTVTFLFSDLETSTRLWEQHHDAMVDARARYFEIVDGSIDRARGVVFSHAGDGVAAVFRSANDALLAAVEAQRTLGEERWGETGPLAARMGLHTGEGVIVGEDQYDSQPLNRCARLMGVAHGGQLLVSGATAALVTDPLTDGVGLTDLGEHRLRDLAHPMQVHQVQAPGLRSEFPPLASVDAFPGNLPLQVTSFVGRDDDVADVLDALGQHRVVTLLGVGGVGKTRLAVQTAAEALPHYPDGVWLCELGPLHDPGQVPDVIADALGIQPRQGETIAESVVLALRSKALLVVLDNCEHLLDAAARLVDALVGACPDVRVLATGREGLGVRGEQMMMVRSLPLPDERATTDEILAAGAVTLFAERARQSGGALDLDDDTAAAVAQVCRRLDGIPLAIELAAARTRMMSPQEIGARLDERFRLLTGGSRTAVERHQTLRQTVDWSYDLLAQRDRIVLDRLGVFSGGFTLDAAEAVVGDDELDALDVMEGIAQLVDKSLVVADRDGHDTRYRLLETIRQYALEQLDGRGETDTLRRCHATWCAAFVAGVSAGMRGPDEPGWRVRFEREFDNVRAALTWATGAGHSDLAEALLGDFRFDSIFGNRLGYVLGPWAGPVLAVEGREISQRTAHTLALRSVDHCYHQRIDDAEQDAREAIASVMAGSCPFDPDPWSALGMAFMFSGRAAELEPEIDAFLALATSTNDDYAIGIAKMTVAYWCYVLDDVERGLPIAEEALRSAQRSGNPGLRANADLWLGALVSASDPTRARHHLERAVDGYQRLGTATMWHVTSILFWCRLAADQGDARWAIQVRRGLDLAQEVGDAFTMWSFLDLYSQALATIGQAETAALLHAAATASAPHMTNAVSLAHRRDTEARLIAALGDQRLDELTARGATLSKDEALALAMEELDRMISGAEATT